MKRALVLFCVLLFKAPLFSQGIQWLGFNREAFSLAAAQNKALLLDLGASWCHWCHVMDDSTYSNKEVTDYLQAHFICTKANQDKRPDLRAKYKDWGWPATIVFDSKGKELLKYSGYASPAEFLTMLREIVEGKTTVSEKAPEAFKKGEWSDSTRRFVENDLYRALDLEKGGFSMYQKYIDADAFEFALLNYKKDTRLRQWMRLSVANSAYINDKAWGGVYQYSTGRDWHYAHFEKLLSMQARYLKIYSKYYAEFKDPAALSLAKNINRYCDRFLKNKDGLYGNSQDADVKEGEHAGDYFALNDTQRLAKGIPRIDSACYLKDNALMAEALIYYWGATGDASRLGQAGEMLRHLLAAYNIGGIGYVHEKSATEAIALGDYLCLCRALLLYEHAAGSKGFATTPEALGLEIIRHFKGEHGYLNYRSASNPLPPNPVLAENIELCRLFNRLYYATGDAEFKKGATQIFSWIISDKVLGEIVAEAGILTLKSELDAEPQKVVLILAKENEPAWENAVQPLWRNAPDYFIIQRAVGDKVPEKYRDMQDATGGSNAAFICSSRSCSAPFFESGKLLQFLSQQAPAKKQQAK